MGRLSQILAEDEIEKPESIRMSPARPVLDVTLRAADKVALIMSNCSYAHLPELITPHCDAQTLADALQKMNYKTVTLADLTLDEMRYFIREYRKLIGNGVYAVFYFVGHGFEVNGQCYLLGVDAPADAHQPQHSLSMDWLLSIFRSIQPSLNLLLLDVCRKFVPYDAISAFVEYSEQFKRYHVAHRNMVYGYSTSGGVGAYEVKGEVNGVFMKYLKNHVQSEISVIDMLNRVLLDIGDDQKVCDVQVPEIRSTLTHPRSLADPLIFDGHTASFDNHTIHWRLMHELPNPATIRFESHQLVATVWFQFCGNFTNKVYVLASISDLRQLPEDEDVDEIDDDEEPSENALTHRAYVEFPDELHCSDAKEHADDEEGISLYWILSGLQKIKGEGGLTCEVHLRHVDDEEKTIEKRNVDIGHILITRIKCLL
uniref:CASPASE_P20 domain-containing protein n=1 Tax=Caenorhabditis japonica TaxID=281687 RepID=A0A8R1IT95_CAEJA